MIIFFVAVLFAGLTSPDQPVRSTDRNGAGKIPSGEKTGVSVIAVIGVIVSILIQGIVSGWMDVLSIYITAGSRTGWYHAVLGMWKRVCGKTGKQRTKLSPYLLVLPDL